MLTYTLLLFEIEMIETQLYVVHKPKIKIVISIVSVINHTSAKQSEYHQFNHTRIV